MALEIQIGADKSDFDKKIKEVELDIKELSKVKLEQITLGLDTKEINAQIKDAKKSLSDLKSAIKDTGNSFSGAAPKIANGGNTLMQFSRIAQDAPFGIMGIGNNITATAEAFSYLSKSSGGAGGALKAVASSLMGSGGILLAVSLVTTGLTIMSQKGITVGDVFSKLTGNFDGFGKALRDVNKEAAKSSAEQVASVGAYTSAAKDINLSMSDRLIAVKKLQDEYPLFFGNLTKEQILNGNVAGAVREVTDALKAKARAQAYAGKLGDLAAKEVELRDRETELIKIHNEELTKRNELNKKLTSEQFNESTYKAWQQADRALKTYKADLADVQDGIRANSAEMDKWAKKSTIEVKASIKLDYKEEKIKKVKASIETPIVVPVNLLVKSGLKMPDKFNIEDALNLGVQHKTGIFSSLAQDMDADREKWLLRMKAGFTKIKGQYIKWSDELRDLVNTSSVTIFSGIGAGIGEALATGGSAFEAVGNSLIASMGSILSGIGDKLISMGSASIALAAVTATFGSILGVGAGLAAIAGGIALKSGGTFLSSKASQNTGKSSVSAGNSVSSPSNSVSGGSYSGGIQNVVFEISGQSLIGVLSNTMNKNLKLGGSIAI